MITTQTIKRNLWLKVLLCGSFLIFGLPFLQLCASKEAKAPTYCQEIGQVSEAAAKSSAAQLQGGSIFSAYSIAFAGYNRQEGSHETGLLYYIFRNFMLLLVLSVVMLAVSFTKRFELIAIMSAAGLALLFFTAYFLHVVGTIQNWEQLHYGYWLFVINSGSLLAVSLNEMRRQPLPGTFRLASSKTCK